MSARSRSNHGSHKAADLFTDRVDESQAFIQSLAAHRAFLDTETDDEANTARNVLVYYGFGGIGKTTLSCRLENWVLGRLDEDDEWGPFFTPVAATVRLDLHQSHGNFDIEEAVIALRRGLGDVKKHWPAFDWAFTTWWSATHPNQEAPDTGNSRDAGVVDAMTETVGNILGDLGIFDTALGLGFRAARFAARKFTQAKDHRYAEDIIEDQDGFHDLLGRCADLPSPTDPHPELLIDMVDLLSLELAAIPSPCPLVVMFIDTFERLQNPDDHARVGEDLLNRLVWNLPQILFVITGRNRLTWDDIDHSRVLHHGPALWPGLVPGATRDPRQHLVGNLSIDDRRSLILRMRTTHNLPMSDDVVEALVEASGGIPQYMDLACEKSITLRDNGRSEITAADVTGSFESLVERVLNDIPSDEQRVLRAAALFTCFDVDLVAAAAKVDVGCASRAVNRSLVEKWADTRLPYRMHDTIRDVIRHAGCLIVGGWADSDWHLAGERSLEELHRRIGRAAHENRHLDRLRDTALAIALVCQEDVRPTGSSRNDWLAIEVVQGPSIGGLRPYVPSTSTTQYGQGFLDFVAGRATELPVEERLENLKHLTTYSHPLAYNAYHHLAYILRNVDRFDESIHTWNEALSIETTPLRLYQRCLTLAMGRRFEDARESSQSLDEDGTYRIETRVRHGHGFPDERIEVFRQTWLAYCEDGKAGESLEMHADYVWNAAFFSGPVDTTDTETLLADCEDVGFVYGIRAALAAQVISDPFSPQARQSLDRIPALGNTVDERPDGMTMLVRCCLAWADGDQDALGDIASTKLPDHHQSYDYIPAEVLLNHMGYSVPYAPAQWLEPFDIVEQRWIQHWHNWYDRTVSR